MSNTANLKKEYAERIAPALMEKFQYSSSMQVPVLKKIVINQGLGKLAIADKKLRSSLQLPTVYSNNSIQFKMASYVYEKSHTCFLFFVNL